MSWYDDFAPQVRTDVPLAPLTWFGLGGLAKYFITPQSVTQLQAIVVRLRDESIPIYVLGGGANLLIRDEGVNGAVIQLDGPEFKKVEIDGSTVRAGAGKDVQKLLLQCTHAGLGGLDCLAGIPGTVGGEVKMNAGGSFGSIGTTVASVLCMDTNGTLLTPDKDELIFEYRQSSITAKFILEATFHLEEDDPERILAKVKEIWMFKKNSQPLAERSAGCIFKNPRGFSAGALIDQAGLKGTSMGGAEVSTKHANFIITNKGTRSSDVLALIELIQQRVNDKFAVKLEPEVVIW